MKVVGFSRFNYIFEFIMRFGTSYYKLTTTTDDDIESNRKILDSVRNATERKIALLDTSNEEIKVLCMKRDSNDSEYWKCISFNFNDYTKIIDYPKIKRSGYILTINLEWYSDNQLILYCETIGESVLKLKEVFDKNYSPFDYYNIKENKDSMLKSFNRSRSCHERITESKCFCAYLYEVVYYTDSKKISPYAEPAIKSIIKNGDVGRL